MPDDLNVHSFDRPRDRAAPTSLRGHWSNGESVTIELSGLTLVVAIKTRCDGCRDFVRDPLHEFDALAVVVVSSTDDDEGEWDGALRPVLVAPGALEELDVRWPPFYVLVDPSTRRVITEGVVFGPSQVAREIAPFVPL